MLIISYWQAVAIYLAGFVSAIALLFALAWIGKRIENGN